MKKNILKKYFLKRLNLIILLLLIIILGTVIDSINPYLFGKIIDKITIKDKIGIEVNLVYFAIVLFCVQILACFEKIIGKIIVTATVNDIKGDLFFNVIRMPYYKINLYDRGELLNRIEFDASTIVDYYVDFVSSLFMIIGNLVISLYFLFKISDLLSIISIFLILLMYLINVIFKNKVVKIQELIKNFSDRYYSWLQDTISNILGIKVFLQELRMNHKYKELLENDYSLQMKSMYIDTQIEFLRGIISLILDVLILLIAALFILNGKMTLGNLVAFNTYLSKLLIAISKILDININKQVVNISYDRILSIFEKNENNGSGLNIERIETINFKDVSFRYNKDKVLKKASFNINEPGIYSFVGENGSGKTTIFSLIEKLYYVDEGEIKINNYDINSIRTESLRKCVLYLTKKPYLINGSILDNIRMGNNETSIEKIQKICKQVGIHNDIIQLEDGYNTLIHETGKNLSSGQLQKLVFVRSYLQKVSIILLDEATSDLDGKSEKDICELIKELSKYFIVLNISHRPLSVQMSRKVFFIQNGEIVKEGKHIDLLRENEEYNKFFK